MKYACARFFPGCGLLAVALALALALPLPVAANPNGATVAQGTASISSSGNTLSIQTSDRAYINWQSFNIGAGETTTFIQPSSSSLVWNHINDPNPSQILGTLNANGYVVLQNSSGFYVGGSAVLNTGGLVMTTTPTPMPDLSSGGAWQFDAPPPAAKIINYGQINIANGGPAFLIANDIENQGIISSPKGNLGLYAGQQVLVSSRPDGRGLSATVTLPQGSVNNSGQLIADAGTIALNAQVVNQGGLVQANSIQEQNGVIEMTASDNLTLGAGSVTSAKGDTSGGSPGGMVIAQSGNTFSDTSTSTINVAGGTGGGQNGLVEIFGAGVNANTIQSQINGVSASQFGLNNFLLLNPFDITLSTSPTTASASSPNFNVGDLAAFSQITLFANDNIELSTPWNLADAANPSSLTLSAGNSVKLDDGTGISAGKNWSINASAGRNNLTAAPASGTDGIYLNGGSLGGSFIQTQDGDITLWAANELQIKDSPDPNSSNPLQNGIRTLGGGGIHVTTQFGDVNTGGNSSGYIFKKAAPFFTVSQTLGGISTAAGGNVDIDAGGNVISYLPLNSTGDPGEDAGTGAFGSQPGNVTINAGGYVYGHYVLGNGIGSITAQKDVGGATLGNNVALSLTSGAWTLDAPNGNIYLQEVRNPNGVFNNAGAATSAGNHLFTYAPQASVTLDAGLGVYLLTTPGSLPRPSATVPALFPPELSITAGSGGVYLDNDVTLFPSPYQDLQITTTGGGNLVASTSTGLGGLVEMLMSDSSGTKYGTQSGQNLFNDQDHSAAPPVADNPNPVALNISGNIEDLSLITTRETVINVGGNVKNSSFSGQNLKPTDKTVINVTGAIVNSASFSSVQLGQAPALVDLQDLPPGVLDQFDTLLNLAVDPVAVASVVVPAGILPSQVAGYWTPLLMLGHANNLNVSTGLDFDSTTLMLGFSGQMGQELLNVLNQPTITVVRFTPQGNPMVDASGHFVTDTYQWVAPTPLLPAPLATLIAESATTSTTTLAGYRIGGPGEFDINAGSIDLGNSFGILSVGALDSAEAGLNRFANLATLTPVGADVKVTSVGDIVMLTSTIASLAGGDLAIQSTAGQIDLGAGGVINNNGTLPFGAFVTGSGPDGPGNISVSAHGNVNVDSSRIAAYDGGSVTVHSDTGNVDAGAGGATAATVQTHFVDPLTMQPGLYQAGVYGSGILAVTLVDPAQVPGSPTGPGNITVTTPEGDINASLGGILQEALNGSIAAGPTITLKAGTLPADGTPHVGNINLGDSGVIGGTVNLSANGNINGLIISQQSSTVNATQNIGITLLSGGNANVSSSSGTVSGTIVGATGATVSGGLGVSADVLSVNANVGGVAGQNTLGGSAAPTAASSSASGTESKDATAQTSGTTTAQNDDDLKKRRSSLLAKLVARVTVLLP